MDEHQEQLRNYIYQQLQARQSPDDIASQLAAAGWPTEHVHQAFMAVQAQVVPTHMQTTSPVVGQPAVSTSPVPPQANGKRRGRIKIGWQLFKQSMRILNGNRYLLRYFAMTWMSVIVINIALFIIVYFAYNMFIGSDGNETARWYIFVFLSYVLITAIVNLYAAALASNLLDLFKGNRQPYRVYLKAAQKKFWPIFVYSLISSIIGMILQYVVERIRFIGWILAWLLGTTWSLGTMFVLPIIMNSDVSAPSAIKQSVKFFKQTWGEGVTAKVTVNGPLALFNILLWLAFIPIIFVSILHGIYWIFITIIIVYIFVALSLAVIGSFANSLINVALYYYAVHGQIPPGFDASMLNQIFIKRKHRFLKKASAQPAN